MIRLEFSKRTKLEAFHRSGGHCEVCKAKLSTGFIEYDHIIPLAMGGNSDADNISCVCSTCHRLKTSTQDIPAIAKSNRQRVKHLGIRRYSRPMPGTKRSGLKKKMNGTVERR